MKIATPDEKATRIFIGSSTEALPLAYCVQENLERYCESVVWEQDVFRPSEFALESLERAIAECWYCIFVLASDDLIVVRGRTMRVTRDNVLFELGMFVGMIGRKRAFLLAPNDSTFQLPSDLFGLTTIRYSIDRQDRNLRAALAPACQKIIRAIQFTEADAQAAGAAKAAMSIVKPEFDPRQRRGHTVSLESKFHHMGRVPPAYTGRFFAGASNDITVLGISLRSFVDYIDHRPSHEFQDPFLGVLAQGVTITLLLLDINSHAAALYARGDQQRTQTLEDGRLTLARLSRMTGMWRKRQYKGNLKVLVYGRFPFAHILRVDNTANTGRLITFPYLPGKKRADTPYLEVYRNSNPTLYAAFSDALDHVLFDSKLVLSLK